MKVRGVMPDHRRIQPLRFCYLSDRTADHRGGYTNLCGLLSVEVSPRVGVTARADKKMAELRFWLEQRRDVKGDRQLGLPQEAAGKIDLSGYLATHITAAHRDHITGTGPDGHFRATRTRLRVVHSPNLLSLTRRIR